MRTCARCILPETFPGVSFDTAGVSAATSASGWPVASAVTSAGGSMPGSIVSRTRTTKVAEDLFSLASVDVQVTVVVPKPKVEPEAGMQTSSGSSSALSDVVTE